MLLAVLLGFLGWHQPAEASTTTVPLPVLPVLVESYLDEPHPDRAAERLAEILQHPEATIESISRILAAGRSYRPAPMGVQRNLSVLVGDHTFPFVLYVPPTYDPSRAFPLVLCLHGAGFTGEAYLDRWQPRLGDDYLLACPTYQHGSWWTRTAEELVLATIKAVTRRYHVDPDRIFLTGMSNGGIGALIIGMHQAPVFAGVAPMASGIDAVLFPFLENFRNTPVYLIHGKYDEVMPVGLSRSIAAELTRLGYPAVYREHDQRHPIAGGHFFPRDELPALVSWFGQQRRTPLPKEVTVVRDATHLLPFYWVRIDATDRIATFSEFLIDRQDEAIRDKVYARLEARVTSPNRIEVQTTRIRRVTLLLNDNLVDFSQPLTVVINGRISFQEPVRPSLHTLLREARRGHDPGLLFPVAVSLSVGAQP